MFTVTELYNSRKVQTAKNIPGPIAAQLEFVALGTSMLVDDDAAARAAFIAAIPTSFLLMALEDLDISTLGGLYWRCTAHYRADTAPLFPAVGIVGPPTPVGPGPGLYDPLSANFNFDISGVTEHITQSKATRHKVKRGGGVAADNKLAIGITKDGQVLGCDRISPQFEWSLSVTFGSVSMAYAQTLVDLVGTTNNATFYGWPANSTLLIGANCQTKEVHRATVNFKFRTGKNLVNLDLLGDASIIIPAKNAWDYLWVSYKDVPDNNVLTQHVDSAYVEIIYDEADWTALGIGA